LDFTALFRRGILSYFYAVLLIFAEKTTKIAYSPEKIIYSIQLVIYLVVTIFALFLPLFFPQYKELLSNFSPHKLSLPDWIVNDAIPMAMSANIGAIVGSNLGYYGMMLGTSLVFHNGEYPLSAYSVIRISEGLKSKVPKLYAELKTYTLYEHVLDVTRIQV
jgi:hypothetical protein